MRDDRGFSLIELIVASAIIAVLAVFFLRGFGIAGTMNRKTAEQYKANVAAGNLMEWFKAKGIQDTMDQTDFPTVAYNTPMPVTEFNGEALDAPLTVTITEEKVTQLVSDDGINAYWCDAKDQKFDRIMEMAQLDTGETDEDDQPVYVAIENVRVLSRDVTADWVNEAGDKYYVKLTFNYAVKYDEVGGAADLDMPAPYNTNELKTPIKESADFDALFLFIYPLYGDVEDFEGNTITKELTNSITMGSTGGIPVYLCPQAVENSLGEWNADWAVGVAKSPNLERPADVLKKEQTMTMYKVTISTPNGAELYSSYLDTK